MLTKSYVRLFWTLALEVAWLQVLSILACESLLQTSLVSSNQQLSYSLFLLLSSPWNAPPTGISGGRMWFPGNASTASVLDSGYPSATSEENEIISMTGECTLRLCCGNSGGVTEQPFRRPLRRLEAFPDPVDPFRVSSEWTRMAFELSGRTMANCLAGVGDPSVWVKTSFRNGWKIHTDKTLKSKLKSVFQMIHRNCYSMNVCLQVHLETYIQHSPHDDIYGQSKISLSITLMSDK